VRFLVLSDLHSNWHALESVIEDAEGQYDRIVCCGDLVGYNAQPGRVLEWTRENCASVIRGNHDKVVAGIEDLEWFNEVAQTAARWTMAQLEQEQLDYLRVLPKGPLQLERFSVHHGSPRDEDEYVINAREATPCFEHLDFPLNFFGHTHLQGGFFRTRGRVGTLHAVRKTERELVIALEPDTAYMINPGSVGQPRDGDARAAFAIFDDEQNTVTLRRVDYPIKKTADEVMQAGLPHVLAFRLFQGL